MAIELFRNRWHRVYFDCLDAFSQPRCAVCFLLAQKEDELVSGLLRPPGQKAPSRVFLRELCVLHKNRLKTTAADDARLLPLLKVLMSDFLTRLAHPPRHPPAQWRHWLHRPRLQCSWCCQISLCEEFLCQALVQCLNDTQFWKGFQSAPLLCAAHLEKCLSLPVDGKGSQRLLNDQSAKLNELLGELIRFEATGAHGECKRSALDWLADFTGLSPGLSAPEIFSAAPDVPPDLMPDARSDPSTDAIQNPEAVLFEKEKLERMVRDLVARLNELETRDASLQYRVAQLSEENKRLEMGYIGANAQAHGLEDLVRDLRAEIKQLQDENMDPGKKAAL